MRSIRKNLAAVKVSQRQSDVRAARIDRGMKEIAALQERIAAEMSKSGRRGGRGS
jgi:hypothetical protein